MPERDNIRAALEWAVENKEVTLGLRLASALENFWMTTDPAEGAHWVEALLARGEVDPRLRGLALRCLGNSAAITADRPRALELYTESLDEFRKTGDELHVAVGLHRLGVALTAAGRPEEAAELVDEALDYFQRSGLAKGEAQCYSFFAFRAQSAGKPDEALAYLDRCVELCRETGFTWWEIQTLVNQALILFSLGRPDDAGRCARESLEIARRIDDRAGIFGAITLLARAAVEVGDQQLGGRLLGALEAEDERAPAAIWRADRAELLEPVIARAGDDFEVGRAQGRSLSFGDAVQLALEDAVA